MNILLLRPSFMKGYLSAGSLSARVWNFNLKEHSLELYRGGLQSLNAGFPGAKMRAV